MIRITAVGDIAPCDHYFNVGCGGRAAALQHGADYLLDKVRQQLAGADVVFGNLECVISDRGVDETSIESRCFRGIPGMARALKASGFNLVNIANNHIMQHGAEAFQDTVELLRENDIAVLGLRGGEGYLSLPVRYEIDSRTIAFLGYSMVPELYASGPLPYAHASFGEIEKDLQCLKQEVDHVCVSLHYGAEAMPEPSGDELASLQRLAEAGADVILGHHSHVFQQVIRYRNSLICLSLGNFVFDLRWMKRLREGHIAKLSLGEGEPGYSLVPFEIASTLQPTPAVASSSTESGSLPGAGQAQYRARLRKLEIRLSILKLLYFIGNLHRGCSLLKMQFAIKKLAGKLLPWRK